jgi:hypothetical protein
MRGLFLRGSPWPWRWLRLAAYYLSILLVFSFICFEVLDLDGSDFPVPSKSPRINLSESHDLRRATLVSVQPWGGAWSAPVDDHTPLLTREDQHGTGALRVTVSPRFRLTLPRATPDDPAA